MIMETWYPGSTPYLTWYTYDSAGALVDATTNMKITIVDPNLNKVADAQTTNNISTGYYYYAGWTVPATGAVTGVYNWYPISTDGTIITINWEGQFRVAEFGED